MTKPDDFFSAFFDDTPSHTCNRCGATEDLHPTGGTTGGAQLYLCASCKTSRAAESQARADRQRSTTARSARRGRDEEPHS